MKAHTSITQEQITPTLAVEILKEGNLRFIKNLRAHRDLLQQVNATRNGQWPFAAVLSCIDSRTSAELIFDQGLGDIFSARVAGNIINQDILGSLEYAVKIAGSKVIVVLGHSKCGAVTSACKGVELGNITALLNKIKPAIETVRKSNKHSLEDTDFIEAVGHQNVRHAIQQILDHSSIIKGLYESDDIAIVGAYYDVTTGVVEFQDILIH